jgi:hypothetical protein
VLDFERYPVFWIPIVILVIALAILSAPWCLLLVLSASLLAESYEGTGILSKASRKLFLALTIGLGVSCLEIAVLRLTRWTAGAHEFEVGILRLYYRLKHAEEFFSLGHAAILLSVLFLLELLSRSWKFTGLFLKFKDGLSAVALIVSVVFSLSCFTQEPLWESARSDHDDMQFAYNLALRDWFDAAANVVAANQLAQVASSPSFDAQEIQDLDQRVDEELWLPVSIGGKRKIILANLRLDSSIATYEERYKSGLNFAYPNRPTKLSGLLDQVGEMPDNLQMPKTWEERNEQLQQIDIVKTRASQMRKESDAAVASLQEIVVDKIGQLSSALAPGELSILPDLLTELASGFADVLWDQSVKAWLQRDSRLTSQELIQKANQRLVTLQDAGQQYIRSVATALNSQEIQEVINRAGRDKGQFVDWRKLESLTPRELREVHSNASKISEEGEGDEGKKPKGEHDTIK